MKNLRKNSTAEPSTADGFEDEKETKLVKSTPALGKATSDPAGLEKIGVVGWLRSSMGESRGKLMENPHSSQIKH